MPVPKYTGTFGQPELLHLLRRVLFGVNQSDLKTLKGKTMDAVVDQLLTFTTDVPPPLKYYSVKVGDKQDPTAIDTDVQYGQTWVNTPIINQATNPDGYRRESLKAWRAGLMINQELNMREALTLFWHNLFSTSTSEVPSLMAYRTNKLHRTNCIGNLRKILTDISLDPTMLRYLNGYLNTATAPDENYGRELQELFSIGKGAGSGYTEDDVKTAARVLTGWTYTTNKYNTTPAVPDLPRVIPNNDPNTPLEFDSRNSQHDKKEKKFSSFYKDFTIAAYGTTEKANYTTMKKELDDMIDMLLKTDECARYICRKFYIYFVHYNITSDIEQNFIVPLAADFKANNYDVKKMLKALFTSAEFFSSCNRGAMIKSPAIFIVSLLRQFGMKLPTSATLEAQYYFRSVIKNYGINMGQEFMDAPDVAGWPAYYQVPQFHEMWVDTASYPNRKVFYETMLKNGISTGTAFYEDVSKNQKFTIDFVEFAKNFSDPSDPNKLIDESCTLLFGSPVSQSIKDQLKSQYLLQNQSSDYYWTDAYNDYVANPSTTDPVAKKVPTILRDLYLDMCSAAEYHLC